MTTITKERLERLYVDQKMTVRQCAEVLGLATCGGISWRLKKFGINARPKHQPDKFHGGGKPPEKHPAWKGGKQAVQCDACGAELKRFPSLVRERNFCNQVCYGKWKRTNFLGEANPNHGNIAMFGEANPNWKGGISIEPYCDAWKDRDFKEDIKERDGFKCQNPDCRKNSDTLTVHHIDYNKVNCNPRNLITLCVSCNARANFNRDFWQAGYEKIIRSKYKNAGGNTGTK